MKRVAPFLGFLTIAQWLGAPANANSPNTLSGCAAIDDPSRRLGCYDHLAGRAPATGAAPAASPSSTFGLPAAHPAPTPTAPPAPPSPQSFGLPAAHPAPASVAPAAPPAPPAPQTFGLYAAEHPLAPADPTLTAKVIGFGSSSNGYSTVSLEGGQVWALLDQADPVLAQGQTVTIRRAALGSFLMTTPSKRSHRVRRLR
jgi:hypothetical protein